MSAGREFNHNLKGYLREYGYKDTPGLSIVPKQPGKDFYDALRQAKDGIPTVFWRGNDSEWLVTLKMSDFMQLYREWEMNTAEQRSIPFYGTGEIDSDDGKHDLTG